MKRSIKIISLFALTVCFEFAFGQSDTPCGGGGTPNLPVNSSCSFTTASTNGLSLQTSPGNGGSPSCNSISSPDGWFRFTVPASGAVTITTQAGSITDGVMAVYSGPCPTPTEVACNDDANGLMPEISLSGLTPGDTYFIRIWNFSSTSGTMDICISEINVTPPPTNIDCSIPDPICSGSPISFTAQANGTEAAVIDPGNNYDCLSTSPNPSWYYLEIDQGGSLAIDITAGSDVDFAIWGPFADVATATTNCNSYGLPLDCSYSTSAVEQANVSNVVAGEVYVLLVTNYANTVQTITLNDAPSNTATTDCSIVPLPVELALFSGYRDGKRVKLNWSTVSETNNSHFVVERSIDGLDWQAFDVVVGVGTTTSLTNYESIDSKPYDRISYYRLKQVDFDGSVNFSDIISVNNSAVGSFEMYPNPGNSVTALRSNASMNSILVTNAQGRTIETIETLGLHNYNLNVSDWRNGVYYVTISTDQGTETQRLTVLK